MRAGDVDDDAVRGPKDEVLYGHRSGHSDDDLSATGAWDDAHRRHCAGHGDAVNGVGARRADAHRGRYGRDCPD
ncbi:MAG: hypothetical protein NVS4B6_11180 [Mycobacterium sp.]